MKRNREYRVKAAFQSSDYRHVKYRHFTDEDWSRLESSLYIGKEEYFSQQIIVNALNGDTLYTVRRGNMISWKGLINRVRIEAVPEDEALRDCFKIRFMQYVENDLRTEVAEPIGDMDSLEAEDGITQAFILEGKIPAEYDKSSADIRVNIYVQKGYEAEKLHSSLGLKLNIYDFVFEDLKSSDDFVLDLWQHPSSWARYYEVELWSDDHFIIIRNMLEELVSLGNRIITVIASDFPWSGQMCYNVKKNPSNLYEYNMIETVKDREGSYKFNYSNLDRYVETAMSVGMDKEIDIFGLSGIWETEMSSPFEDCDDCPEPMKISYYDESEGILRYMDTKEELKLYVSSLINHIEEKGWAGITKIMSDHPSEDRVFIEKKKFLEELAGSRELSYKSAIFLKDIVKSHYDKLDEVSLCSSALLQLDGEMDGIKKYINDNGGHVTWYVCWFPERPNNFIETPLIDNRLIGWFTYLFNMDGFLRWDFALWTQDPWKDVSYRYPNWKAGDMLFVYPGKNMKPKRSLRWENLRYGIQDYQMFKRLEECGFSREEILDKYVRPLLGSIQDYEVKHARSVKIRFNEELQDYIQVKREILEILETKLNKK